MRRLDRLLLLVALGESLNVVAFALGDYGQINEANSVCVDGVRARVRLACVGAGDDHDRAAARRGGGATLAAPPATPKKKPSPVSNTPGETEAAAQPTASQSGEASASSDVSGVPADQIGTAVTVITRKDSRTARSATRRMRCATCPASR